MNHVEDNEVDLTTLKQKLEIEKLQREIEKINHDTDELKKKWYKRPQWIAALSPLLIGCLTLIVAWASGFLQAQSTLNKIQQETFNKNKDSIDRAIKRSILVSDSLSRSNLILAQKNARYDTLYKKTSDLLNVMKDSVKTFAGKSKYLANELFSIQKENTKLNSEIDSLHVLIAILEFKASDEKLVSTPYMLLPYSSIADSTIHVTDEEIRQFMKSVKKTKRYVSFKK